MADNENEISPKINEIEIGVSSSTPPEDNIIKTNDDSVSNVSPSRIGGSTRIDSTGRVQYRKKKVKKGPVLTWSEWMKKNFIDFKSFVAKQHPSMIVIVSMIAFAVVTSGALLFLDLIGALNAQYSSDQSVIIVEICSQILNLCFTIACAYLTPDRYLSSKHYLVCLKYGRDSSLSQDDYSILLEKFPFIERPELKEARIQTELDDVRNASTESGNTNLAIGESSTFVRDNMQLEPVISMMSKGSETSSSRFGSTAFLNQQSSDSIATSFTYTPPLSLDDRLIIYEKRWKYLGWLILGQDFHIIFQFISAPCK